MAQPINAVQQRTVRVTGRGETKQKAFANALSGIQKQIVADETTVTLQITPLKVIPVALKVEAYKERFLFIFFPRVRTTVTVTIDVEVAVNTVELANVPFTVTNQSRVDAATLSALKGGK